MNTTNLNNLKLKNVFDVLYNSGLILFFFKKNSFLKFISFISFSFLFVLFIAARRTKCCQMSSLWVANWQPNMYILILSIAAGISHAAKPKRGELSFEIERHFPCSANSGLSFFSFYQNATLKLNLKAHRVILQ